MKKNKLLGHIVIDQKVMVGKPVIRGTRLTVQYILGLLAHGAMLDEILHEYDGLTREDILACLLFATEALEDTTFLPLTTETVQMRFIVDECTGPTVAHWLRQNQHDVFSVYEESGGLDDEDVLKKAVTDNRILITNDKDFGEMIFHEKKPHKGVILLRLEDERIANKVKVLKMLLEKYADRLVNNFVVVTESAVRIAPIQSD